MEKELQLTLETEIETLLYGSKESFKQAKRNISKLYHSDFDNFHKIASFVLEYFPKYDEVENWQNKAAFISGIDLFFLSLSDDYFDELKRFTIGAIQHPNGAVRQAIINTSRWLHMSLSSRIDSDFRPHWKKKIEDLAKEKERAKKQFLDLVLELEQLIEKYDDGKHRGDYIDDMKPSIHKSLQIMWDYFAGTHCYRKLIEQIRPISSDLFFKRKEIENKIVALLKRSRSFADLDFLKDIIYNETSTADFQEALMLFDTGYENAPEIHEVLEVINEAWNHFPHRSLDGLCPVEMIEMYKAR